MADPVCNFCENEYGIFILTNLMEGDTKVLGPQCLIGTALSLAASVTTDMSPDLAEAYGALFDQIVANDTRPKRVSPQSAPGKRRKPGANSASEAPESGEQPTSLDTSASPDDGISGNDSAGALTQADLDQLDAASDATAR